MSACYPHRAYLSNAQRPFVVLLNGTEGSRRLHAYEPYPHSPHSPLNFRRHELAAMATKKWSEKNNHEASLRDDRAPAILAMFRLTPPTVPHTFWEAGAKMS
jgi:hypothetical protein